MSTEQNPIQENNQQPEIKSKTDENSITSEHIESNEHIENTVITSDQILNIKVQGTSHIKSTTKTIYGWKKPMIKKQYPRFKEILETSTLPTKIDLRTQYSLPAPYDQGNLGSCTANALGFCYQFLQIKFNTKYKFQPSRLFIYYCERALEHSVSQDNGAMIASGILVLKTTGTCEESLCPYNISKFTNKPSTTAYTQASKFKSLTSVGINSNLLEIKNALADGFPVAFGFQVFESFESNSVSSTGIMSMPTTSEEIVGGHATVIVGYDDDKNYFIVRNSWGSNWGDRGYFYMPYAYVTSSKDYCDEFNVISSITDPIYPPVPTPAPIINKPKPKPRRKANPLIIKKK